jgi:phosphoribosylformimino-5-aminoimidazole carboxamide ribotide isomerase
VELYPAIDLRAGHAVRLHQGDYGDETVYGDDPVALAESFAAAGARWIHVVDLDAARSGEPVNRPVIGRIAAAVDGQAAVQAGGGVRSVGDAAALADAGVARVVIGSAAVESPQLVEQVAPVVPAAVGLDHRGGRLAVHGWTKATDVGVLDALGRFPSAAAFIVTDIARDGTLLGPDIAGLTTVAAASALPVIASGGVASLDDLRALSAIPGVSGVITGKALYEQRFTLADALAVMSAAA